MALTHNLGFPRIGARRELKQALEAYWRGDIDDTVCAPLDLINHEACHVAYIDRLNRSIRRRHEH